ncbi:MAG: isochorismate synthase [Chlamydiota bacterium]
MKIYWADREGNAAPLGCTFHCKPFLGPGSKLPSNVERVEELPQPRNPIQVLRRTFFPDRETWIQGIKKATDAIGRKELQKVVLARICVLELSKEPDPFAITAALKQKAEGAFVFCLQSEKSAFLGASPERLFQRRQNQLVCEAMAGTRPRGRSLAENETLQRDLLSNPKDLREFSPVQSYLQKVLTPLCKAPLHFTPISVHQTKNVQHLYSQCRGTLKHKISNRQILKTLHPTPALCGTPKENALQMIQELEPFHRGYYGGAIGWTTPDASEWIVGIRSCLIEGKKATLFSGTGIVEGSEGASEWDELDQKLKLYDGIFV